MKKHRKATLAKVFDRDECRTLLKAAEIAMALLKAELQSANSIAGFFKKNCPIHDANSTCFGPISIESMTYLLTYR